jgi:hypothetical protein
LKTGSEVNDYLGCHGVADSGIVNGQLKAEGGQEVI